MDARLPLQTVLDSIAEDVAPMLGAGRVADYIPALARVPKRHFGMAVRTVEGEEASVQDAQHPFSIQSISKVFTLTMAMQVLGDALWQRIGREPSGDPFNSLVQLEHEQGKPRNPFINAGAIAVADRLVSAHRAPLQALTAFVSDLCGEAIQPDAEVADSEAATGFRNLAMANFIKSFGKLDNEVSAVLGLYFRQCSLSMNCIQLARAVSYLCLDGRHPRGHATAVITPQQTRRINALMLTCGTYDAAGEFAFRIGLPCKSGVGGGIIAILPDRLSLAVWSPGLEASGNSAVGMRALELFVEKTGMSVF